MDYKKAGEFWTEKEADMKQMPTHELQKDIEGFIKANNTCVLGTAWDGTVRCTPLSYKYVAGKFFIFSEGGKKFLALEKNKNVGLSINSVYRGPGSAVSVQITATAQAYSRDDAEYGEMLSEAGLKADSVMKMPTPLYLIVVKPSEIIYLNSSLREKGYGVRQTMSC